MKTQNVGKTFAIDKASKDMYLNYKYITYIYNKNNLKNTWQFHSQYMPKKNKCPVMPKHVQKHS